MDKPVIHTLLMDNEIENQKVGEMSEDELYLFIKNTVQELERKKRGWLKQRITKRVVWTFVLVLLAVVLIYKTFYYESGYTVLMDKSDLYIVKTVGWKTVKRQISVVDGKWQLRYDFDKDLTIWGSVFTPFEVRFNDYYKFIFAGHGTLFWVSNDKTSVRQVKLIDGEWKFQSATTDEWLDFDFSDY